MTDSRFAVAASCCARSAQRCRSPCIHGPPTSSPTTRIEWLGKTSRDKPFFLYLSHKGVHSDFVPAERHKGSLKDVPFAAPATMAPTAAAGGTASRRGCATSATAGTAWSTRTTRRWTSPSTTGATCETLRAVDDSVGRVRRVAERSEGSSSHAGHLHGRQRLRVRRARADRQAHGVRLGRCACRCSCTRRASCRRASRSTASSPTSTSRRRCSISPGRRRRRTCRA